MAFPEIFLAEMLLKVGVFGLEVELAAATDDERLAETITTESISTTTSVDTFLRIFFRQSALLGCKFE